MTTTVTVQILGSHPHRNAVGTASTIDGRFVLEAPDGIGRVDRVRVRVGEIEVWALVNELRIIEGQDDE